MATWVGWGAPTTSVGGGTVNPTNACESPATGSLPGSPRRRETDEEQAARQHKRATRRLRLQNTVLLVGYF